MTAKLSTWSRSRSRNAPQPSDDVPTPVEQSAIDQAIAALNIAVEKADGAHELHKVKITNDAVSSDDIVTEAGMCILRPLFLGNGELATVVGHYNDQNSDGTYNGSFKAWELKPLFTHA